ncbi:Platelet-activating factor acetylhydrolase IB subunit gamma [Cichlidogyrus casuarinus]|uniref:Platelet-activating factor acetylhydrolase IB subunit gamma n=1 Tax=Cichlidogyrus casuarinus TaxID=1844966 RepID=A0ABD2Q0I9_9PLAT
MTISPGIPANKPILPDDVESSRCWLDQHERFVYQSIEKEPDVVLLGDSVLQNFQFSKFYKNLMEPLHLLNFSINGDQTQHLLWRVSNGELDHLTTKVIVLNVGTHNSQHSADEICEGIQTIVHVLLSKLPTSHIIVLGLLPCGKEPNPKREKHAQVNLLLTKCLRYEKNVTLICPDAQLFVQSDGKISHLDMYDYLHPTEQGYEKLGSILLEDIQMILKTFIKTDAPA